MARQLVQLGPADYGTGAGTPLAKLLLQSVSPWLLAGLLYLGSGVGLTLYRLLRRAPLVHLPRQDLPWLLAAICAGGVIGPVLLMLGLTGMPASGAELAGRSALRRDLAGYGRAWRLPRMGRRQQFDA